MKVSVVVSVYNGEGKLDECLDSVKNIAEEIIVVNGSSTDKTVEIAKKYTDKIYDRPNFPMFNTNKNYGFTKVTGEWILNLDHDERLTDELVDEIKNLKDDVGADGFYIPRKNIIFGKWIEHTGWYPDPQLRLFRKNKGRFEEKHIHELVTVDGEVKTLVNAMIHLNYDSVTHFLDKTIKNYTTSEAESLLAGGYKYDKLDMVRMPISEFLRRYFMQKGYKDGIHGLILSLLMAFYHLIVFIRLWETKGYPESEDSYQIFEEGRRKLKKEMKYWVYEKKIEEQKSKVGKNLLKIQRKITP